MRSLLLPWVVAVGGFGLSACSSTPKKVPELSAYEGQRVALIEVDGEPTTRKMVEVSLVNQLVQHGSFELIPRSEVDAARKAPESSPTDWKGISQKAGADVALRAKVLRFEAEETQGYDKIGVHDSQLEAETGRGKTDRLVKVRSLTGTVAIELEFTSLRQTDVSATRTAVAESTETVRSTEEHGSARLPPKLAFLERLMNRAFEDFFKRYR